MKSIILILLIIFSSGCLATHEYTGIVDGLNRGMTQGMLLQDPGYSYYNIIEQQNRQREARALNSQLEAINRNLQMQNNILLWNDPVFFPKTYGLGGFCY